MRKLFCIFFILIVGNSQVAFAQLYAIQKLDDFVLSNVNLKHFGEYLEGDAIGDLKYSYDYKISNNVNTILSLNADDLLDEFIKISQ